MSLAVALAAAGLLGPRTPNMELNMPTSWKVDTDPTEVFLHGDWSIKRQVWALPLEPYFYKLSFLKFSQNTGVVCATAR